IMIVITFIDYNFVAKISPVLYGLAIISLIAVLFTEPINGARSWFKISETTTVQPSEFAKIVLVIFLAYVLVKLQKNDKTEINRIWKLAIVVVTAGVPILLIAMQPDYGTVAAFILGVAFMLFASGIDKKYVIAVLLIIVIAVPILYMFVLPEHARSRIDVFLNPELSPRGARIQFNTIKTCNRFREAFSEWDYLWEIRLSFGYLYPKTTDFIFSVIRGGNGIYCCRSSNCFVCNNDYKIHICCKNCKR
ncbi:MAG: FtsW/RodA/SpoVE family cell cycle protein, partial [Clostridia bacterium]|nr:FtsW/RodA/SpoVE family cell cycle protein [Clostridia bacterium]